MSDQQLPDLCTAGLDPDPARDQIARALVEADPKGERLAAVFRETFDLLYDGQHTGRYRWDHLMKSEKTHYGSMFEIRLRRAFDDVIDDVPNDDSPLDYRVLGHDIDCKYSQSMNGWMLPPECFGHLLLVGTSNDQKGNWSLGIVRASDANRREKGNRDKKTQLNPRGTSQIRWLFRDAALPPNILLTLSPDVIERIFAPRSGQQRILELLRLVTGQRIGRNTIATVAQQKDYMARVRDNGGGARTVLRNEGYLITGDFASHRAIARQLGGPEAREGETVSFRVVPCDLGEPDSVLLMGRTWRVARPDDVVTEHAPVLPSTGKQSVDA